MAGFLSQATKVEKKLDRTSLSLASEINKWFKRNIPLINKYSSVRLLSWVNEKTVASLTRNQEPNEKSKFYLTFINNFTRTAKGPKSSSLAFNESDAAYLDRALGFLFSLINRLNQTQKDNDYTFAKVNLKMVQKDQIEEKSQQLEKSLFYFDALIKETLCCDVEELVAAITKITNAVYYNETKSIDCYHIATLTGLSAKTCSFFADKHSEPFNNSDLQFFLQKPSYVDKPFICIRKDYYCFTPFYLLNNGFDLVKQAIISCGSEYEKKFAYLENWMNGSQEDNFDEDDNPDSIDPYLKEEEEKVEDVISDNLDDKENEEDKENANFYDELFDEYDEQNSDKIEGEDNDETEDSISNNVIFEDADNDYAKADLEQKSQQKLNSLEAEEYKKTKPEVYAPIKTGRIAAKKLASPNEEETHREVEMAIDNFEDEEEEEKEDQLKAYYSGDNGPVENDKCYDDISDTYELTNEPENFEDSEEDNEEDKDYDIYEELDSSIQPNLFNDKTTNKIEEKETSEIPYSPNDSEYIEDITDEAEDFDMDETEVADTVESNESESINLQDAYQKEKELAEKKVPIKDDGLILKDIVNIINFMPIKDGKVFDYLKSMTQIEQNSLLKMIEKARKAWLEDKNDKVFTDKDNEISFAVCSEKKDEILQDERINNISAIMRMNNKYIWDLIELRYSENGLLTKTNFIHIDINDFPSRRQKAIELLVRKLKGLNL